jgi:alcohol dehydrogenase YqhD (iron-dependent ADH family)
MRDFEFYDPTRIVFGDGKTAAPQDFRIPGSGIPRIAEDVVMLVQRVLHLEGKA